MVSTTAVSLVLVKEEAGVERPNYCISRAMVGVETRYLEIEKLVLAMVVSYRKLRPYFKAHAIIVPTNQPLRQVLSKPNLLGRIVKWMIETEEFDIRYRPKLLSRDMPSHTLFLNSEV